MKLLVRFGNWSIDFYFGRFEDDDEAMRFGYVGFKGFLALMNEKELVQEQCSNMDASSKLIAKLKSSKFHLSTDPRDKIYGLLELT